MGQTVTGLLNYCWRLFATGICFATFSLGSLLLSLLVFPLINLFVKDSRRRQILSRKIIHRSFRAFMRWMCVLGVLEFDNADACKRLARCRGNVIVANHPSLIDAVALISEIPHADCIIKEELLHNFFFRGALKAAGYVNNSGDAEELLHACQKSLDQGYSLVIFPEGTRTSADAPIALKRGASNIALRCGVDVIPVFIDVKPTTLTKNERWYNIPEAKVRFRMRVGKQIEIKDFQKKGQSLSVGARRLTAYLENSLTKGMECYEQA